MALPKEIKLSNLSIENGFLNLRTKPTARMGYSFIPPSIQTTSPPEHLLVFLSGLDNPLWVWQKTLTALVSLTHTQHIPLPPMLLYDRFGVGASDPDPSDVGKPPEEYHDAGEAVQDLHQLITQAMELKYSHTTGATLPKLIFIAHSFGATIARLYAAAHLGTVSSLLILDSAISSTPAEKFIPNPDDSDEWRNRARWHPAFLDTTLISEEMCRAAIAVVKASPFSGYALTTRERMRWDNMPRLLPYNDRPKLPGVRVTGMVYDPDVFYDEDQ
jgi:pimeloyl-ACP methyl ester carboxylesterase